MIIGNHLLLENGNRSSLYRSVLPPPPPPPRSRLSLIPPQMSAVSIGHLFQNRSVGAPSILDSTGIVRVHNRTYRMLDIIREGQGSRVLGVMNNYGARFAIKIVDFNQPAENDGQDAYRMFMKELQFLSVLGSQSSRIVKVFAHEVNLSAGTGKILMELGSTDFRSLLPLREIPSRKIINEPVRRFYWRQMVEAIQLVHSNNIAHADIKPENFVIVNNRLKLIDFGMSFYIPPGLSSLLRPIAGTPDYMPPEVCRSNTTFAIFGYKADIWSLGCILFEMTFGYRPFEHVTRNSDKLLVIGSIQSPAVAVPPCGSSSLFHILSSCLHVRPSERPSSEQVLSHPYLLNIEMS